MGDDYGVGCVLVSEVALDSLDCMGLDLKGTTVAPVRSCPFRAALCVIVSHRWLHYFSLAVALRDDEFCRS